MLKFKLNKLLTTSCIALAMSGTAIQSGQTLPSSGAQAAPGIENKVNQSASGAVMQKADYSLMFLKNRANKGDKDAEDVIKEFNLDVDKDPAAIRQAVSMYSAKHRSNLDAKFSHAAKAAGSSSTPPLSGNLSYRLLKNKADKGDELAKKVMEDFKLNEATDPEKAKQAVASYTAESKAKYEKQRVGGALAAAPVEAVATPVKESSDECQAEVRKYKEEISTLKTELETAKLSEGKLGASEQKIYEELDTFLKTDPSLLYKKVKELLDSLLKENESEVAITKFLATVNKYQGSDARGEKVNTIYIKLNEEGVLKDYLKSVMRKELQGAQREIYAEGDKVLAGLSLQPDLRFLVQNPLLMVCYTDKDKAKGFWITTNLKTYKQFIASSKLEHLKAVYSFLTKKWKLRHPLDVINTTPMDDFVISIYDQIKSKKQPGTMKLSAQQVEDFIKDRLKTDLTVDYAKLEQDNLRFEGEFKALNIQDEIAKNPFMKILEVKNSDQWKKLDFDRSTYDKMIEFLAFSSLNQLKAILYHLSKMEFSTTGDLNEQYFYKAVNEEVNKRDKQHQMNASQKMTSSVKSEMNRIVAKIGAGASSGTESSKKGAGAPLPPALPGLVRKNTAPVAPPPPPLPQPLRHSAG